MGNEMISRVELKIKAPAEKVWQALTRPEMVKQYFFGTQVSSDWKPGSPVIWRGEWQGKNYEDKGQVLEAEPGKRLAMTYWSSMAGLPDKPEYYKTVRYELSTQGQETVLVLTQNNNRSQAEAEHTQKNWEMTLGKMKELLETGKI